MNGFIKSLRFSKDINLLSLDNADTILLFLFLGILFLFEVFSKYEAFFLIWVKYI